jgi:hypothetical protein
MADDEDRRAERLLAAQAKAEELLAAVAERGFGGFYEQLLDLG